MGSGTSDGLDQSDPGSYREKSLKTLNGERRRVAAVTVTGHRLELGGHC